MKTILCTHKYVKYAKQQIISIKNQINVNINLVVSIDSNDISVIEKWIDLLDSYFSKDDYIILKGPQKGFSSNFINAIIKSNCSSEYMAFSDHDDIWDKNKLYVAINSIKDLNNNDSPILYGSRTRYIDDSNNFITYSNMLCKPLGFQNALVQCLAGGNTMVFNKSLYSLITEIGFINVKSHDWWLYIVTTATGGKVIFDKNPYISYRQHENNVSGGNKSIYQVLYRVKSLISGDFRDWNKSNIYYLSNHKKLLNFKNNKILNDFVKVQDGNIFERFFYFFTSGIYRHSFLDNIAIFLCALFKRL